MKGGLFVLFDINVLQPALITYGEFDIQANQF